MAGYRRTIIPYNRCMLKRLRVDNFKSWESTGAVRLAPLTGLFGTNSSGKTSILQTLLLLKQTAESPDRKRVLHTGDDRSLVDLGTYYDIIHDHRLESAIRFELGWQLAEPLRIADPEQARRTLYDLEELDFEVDILVGRDRAYVEQFMYRFDEHAFGLTRRESRKANGQGKDEYELQTGDYPARRTTGRPWPLPSPSKCYGFPDEASTYYQNTGFLPDFVKACEDALDRIAYLGPLREYPRRTYVWAGERPVDVGQKGEQAIPALLAARAENLKSGRGVGRRRRYKPIEQRIAEWLKTMGLVDSFTLQPLAANRKEYEIRVKRSPSSAEVALTDVGFGVSQVLPVLVLCYFVPEHSTLLLEQPEIHLHPSVQANLADVFIDVVTNRNVQIVLESHSEHLLRRLQRRVAEERMDADQAALYFCTMSGGTSHLQDLDLDVFGNILNWPDGFFGDEIGDLTAMTEAAASRRMAQW